MNHVKFSQALNTQWTEQKKKRTKLFPCFLFTKLNNYNRLEICLNVLDSRMGVILSVCIIINNYFFFLFSISIGLDFHFNFVSVSGLFYAVFLLLVLLLNVECWMFVWYFLFLFLSFWKCCLPAISLKDIERGKIAGALFISVFFTVFFCPLFFSFHFDCHFLISSFYSIIIIVFVHKN